MPLLSKTALTTLAVAAAACAIADASGVATLEQVGTIRATVDGEARTWYVLESTVGGELEPGALWMEREAGTVTVVVGGYDRRDVPFDTFERDPQSGMVTSYGDYDGDVLTLTFPVQKGATGSRTFPLGDTEEAQVLLVPDMKFEAMLSSQSGSIQVETVDWDDGRFSGTFEATLVNRDGSRTLHVTDGTFEVERARSLEEIR